MLAEIIDRDGVSWCIVVYRGVTPKMPGQKNEKGDRYDVIILPTDVVCVSHFVLTEIGINPARALYCRYDQV